MKSTNETALAAMVEELRDREHLQYSEARLVEEDLYQASRLIYEAVATYREENPETRFDIRAFIQNSPQDWTIEIDESGYGGKKITIQMDLAGTRDGESYFTEVRLLAGDGNILLRGVAPATIARLPELAIAYLNRFKEVESLVEGVTQLLQSVEVAK